MLINYKNKRFFIIPKLTKELSKMQGNCQKLTQHISPPKEKYSYPNLNPPASLYLCRKRVINNAGQNYHVLFQPKHFAIKPGTSRLEYFSQQKCTAHIIVQVTNSVTAEAMGGGTMVITEYMLPAQFGSYSPETDGDKLSAQDLSRKCSLGRAREAGRRGSQVRGSMDGKIPDGSFNLDGQGSPRQ